MKYYLSLDKGQAFKNKENPIHLELGCGKDILI